ncbi:MAG TPA: 2-phospho-L-lactate transferase CofD family protein, partial [Blastocatellia bacterium]|nr:2-phospho-L-lactate transferase CofD family protein [Blastocatellia bacterium]
IIPNLLVDDIVDAMNASNALKVYICNIMTQPGETDGFSVEDHLLALLEYSADLALDYIVVNSAPINPALREKYLADGALQVEFNSHLGRERSGDLHELDFDAKNHRKISIVCDDLLNENDLVRHDPHRLANLVLKIHRMEKVAALSIRNSR